MNEIFFPSCNFTVASRKAADKLEEYMAERMGVARCCRQRQDMDTSATAIYFCQACRETIEGTWPGMAAKNLFVWLNAKKDFPWPDYGGLKVSIQDCWRDREHREIHRAVRSALRKMGVEYVELKVNRSKADYCGNIHFEPTSEEYRAIRALHPKTRLSHLSQEEQAVIFREQAAKHGGLPALCYCNRCKSCLELGGGKAVHLMELVMGTYEIEEES